MGLRRPREWQTQRLAPGQTWAPTASDSPWVDPKLIAANVAKLKLPAGEVSGSAG